MEDGRDVPPWTTIMDDLPFLIANDDGLTEQLTRVCDLLDDFPDDDLMDFDVASPRSSELSSSELDVQSTLPPPSSKKSKRTSFEVRQKHELQRLRDEVRELKTKLLHCESNKRDGSNDSFWKQAASIARAEKIKALHENEALHDAVTQQATFIEQMQRVFRKKPRLDTFRDIESESWQSYTLSAHASLRTAAIHAIADRQRSRMHHTFLRAGVLDRVDDLYRATFQPQSNGSIMFELVNHVTLAASYQSIGAALWQTMGNRHTTFQLNGVEETLEEIDACTVYGHVTSLSADGSVVWHSNLIRKYYPQPGKFQFVGRSVLDDALSPTAPGDMVDSKAAWVQIVPLGDTSCRLTFVVQVDLGQSFHTSDIDDIELAAMMKKLTIFPDAGKTPPIFPCLPSYVTDYDGSEVTSVALRNIIETGKSVQRALSGTIAGIIEAEQRCSPHDTAHQAFKVVM